MYRISRQNIRKKQRPVKFRNVVDVFIHFEVNPRSALTAIYSTCIIDKRILLICSSAIEHFPSLSKTRNKFTLHVAIQIA